MINAHMIMWTIVIGSGIWAVFNALRARMFAPEGEPLTISPWRKPVKYGWLSFLRIPRRQRWTLYWVAMLIFAMLGRLGVLTGPPRPALPDAYQQSQIVGAQQLQAMVLDPSKPINKVLFYEQLKDVIVLGHDFKSYRIPDEPNSIAIKAELSRQKIDFETLKPQMVPDPNSNVWTPLGIMFFALVGAWGVLSYIGRGIKEMHRLEPVMTGFSATVVSEKKEGETKQNNLTKFEHVGGCDEALARCQRIVQFMKHPALFAHFGSEPPKGVLLLGPPGTGKTLLARATGGEVDAHFLVISASEIVELFVGVGAARFRAIFAQAKALHASDGRPVIIFIDEIDAIGKKRGGGHGGNQEYDQTLNQLFTEMDGYTPLEGIIVMAATNLGDSLDPGLLRRFTYHVIVDAPDMKGRLEIFKIQTKGKKLASDVSLEALARRTPGFVGDTIKKVVVEAATLAAIRRIPDAAGMKPGELEANVDPEITLKDFDEAIDSVQNGDALLSKSRNQSYEDRFNTAVHEVSHAVVPTECGGDPVTKISVVMRGAALGMMQMHSETDSYGQKRKKLILSIKTMLAGRIGQEIVLGEDDGVDTGAGSDFERANKLARVMTGQVGMSKQLGYLTLALDDNGFPVGNIGDDLMKRFTAGWTEIAETCRKEVFELIYKRRARIRKIAAILVEEESMLGDRFRELWKQFESLDTDSEV